MFTLITTEYDDDLNTHSSLESRGLLLEVFTNHETGATLRDEVLDTLEADQSNVNNRSGVNNPVNANNMPDVNNTCEEDADGYIFMPSSNYNRRNSSPLPSPTSHEAIYITVVCLYLFYRHSYQITLMYSNLPL